MSKIVLAVLLPIFAFLGYDSQSLPTAAHDRGQKRDSGTLEKMIVDGGTVTIDLDLARLNGLRRPEKSQHRFAYLRFTVDRESFFTLLAFNGELRGPLPSTMGLIPESSVALPEKLAASYRQLVLESVGWGSQYDLVVRDAKTGFVFFNIEGHQFDYNAGGHALKIGSGRLLLSNQFANELGRPTEAGVNLGRITLSGTTRTIEVNEIVDGEVKSDTLPALNAPQSGMIPGPDVIVGDISGLTQFGSAGTQVGLAFGTDSCNAGTQNLHWFALPDNDHPVIPQNLYRLSGGANNDERFEQIGESNAKHAFNALGEDICGFGCNGVSGTNLGSVCSDPYTASENAGPSLGSRAWINPFTGSFPRGDSPTPPNSHVGHIHNGVSHRLIVEMSDLDTTQNVGATYYAEGQYITPHEYVWCQANPGQCNMYNNVSYRQFSVTGTTSFTFSPIGSTFRQTPAIYAWPGATVVQIQPDPGNDGIGFVAYRVTSTGTGLWHYEYAVYNENLDRSIQSFSIPLGSGITLTNIGFHGAPQQPGWAADGTVGNTGYSNAAWAQTQTFSSMIWNSETFAQNPNANAIRWGTLYNFRFDSNRPPTTVNASLGFFKTGNPVNVQVQGPSTVAIRAAVSGRVTSSNGIGISGARVTITDATGNTFSVLTSPFGYYSFEKIPGGTYTFKVQAKFYSAAQQIIDVNDNLSGVDFVLSQ